MLNIIKTILLQLVDNIDSGNTNINEDLQLEIIELYLKLNSKEYSKIEAANYIGVSRATFDNYISKGLLPKGIKKRGVNALFWNKFDLDKYLQEHDKDIRKRL